jgi:type IVB pilus formation R64 PilN family outer membrane protein
MLNRIAPVAAAVVLLVSGCATQVQEQNKYDHAQAQTYVNQRQEQARAAVLDAEKQRIAAQDVPVPYLAGNAVPLARDVQMPEPLKRSIPVTAMFSSGPVDLLTALKQVSQSSGIMIVATPDALLPPSAFAPKTSVANPPVQAPFQINLRAQNVPLWKLLDEIASQAQVSWRPTASGAEFYRVETKAYELMTIPQVSGTTAALGRNSSAQNAFSSDSKTTFALTDVNQLKGIESSIDPLLTAGGKFVVVRENQTVVVTDTPAAHQRVDEFIKAQNKAMSRRVRLIVEAIDVVSKNGSDFGIDWNIVYNTTSTALNASPPTSVANQQTGRISIQQTVGPFAGSSMVVRALNEIGTVVNRQVFPLTTTSGRPVTRALRTTFNYVDQIQTTAVASSVLNNTPVQAPTVNQKDETVGTVLTIVPTAKNDGTVFLSVSFDVTSAEPLRPYTVGQGAAAVTVQQKTINGSGVIQEVPVRTGRTEVIGGIELLNATNTTRSLGEGVPIIAGGSATSNNTKSVTVLLVTAVVEEGV